MSWQAGATGTVSPAALRHILQAMTLLDLSRGEVTAVVSNAAAAAGERSGDIVWADFLLDSHEIFSMLAQERTMNDLNELHKEQFDVTHTESLSLSLSLEWC